MRTQVNKALVAAVAKPWLYYYIIAAVVHAVGTHGNAFTAGSQTHTTAAWTGCQNAAAFGHRTRAASVARPSVQAVLVCPLGPP